MLIKKTPGQALKHGRHGEVSMFQRQHVDSDFLCQFSPSPPYLTSPNGRRGAFCFWTARARLHGRIGDASINTAHAAVTSSSLFTSVNVTRSQSRSSTQRASDVGLLPHWHFPPSQYQPVCSSLPVRLGLAPCAAAHTGAVQRRDWKPSPESKAAKLCLQ